MNTLAVKGPLKQKFHVDLKTDLKKSRAILERHFLEHEYTIFKIYIREDGLNLSRYQKKVPPHRTLQLLAFDEYCRFDKSALF